LLCYLDLKPSSFAISSPESPVAAIGFSRLFVPAASRACDAERRREQLA
jgi:hypothetical protein